MKLISRILLGCVLGILIVLYWLPHDPQFKDIMYRRMKRQFENMFECYASYYLKSFNLFTLRLHAKDVYVTARDKTSWFWKAGLFNVDAYWPMLLDKKLGLNISLANVEAASYMQDGKIAIVDHLKKMILETQDIPICLKNLRLHNTIFTLLDPAHDASGFFSFSSEFNVLANRVRMTGFIVDGRYTWHGLNLFDHLNLRLNIDKSERAPFDISCSCNGKFDWVLGKTIQECYITALLHKHNIDLTLLHKMGDVHLEAQYAPGTPDKLVCSLQTQLEAFQQFFKHYIGCFPTGDLDVSCNASFEPELALESTIHVRDCACGFAKVNEIKAYGQYKNDMLEIEADLFFNQQQQCVIQGTYNLHTYEGTWSLFNETILYPALGWHIEPGAVSIQGRIQQDNIDGTFDIEPYCQALQKSIKIQGSFSLQNGELIIEGIIEDVPFNLGISLFPFKIKHFVVTDDQWTLIKGAYDPAHESTLYFNFSLVKHFLKHVYGIDVRGQADIICTINTKGNTYTAHISMEHANIHIPGTFNFIQHLHATLILDPIKQRLIIKNFQVDMYKGIIKMKRGVVRWDDSILLPSFYLPYVLEEVFINKAKDLFCVISGYITFSRFNSPSTLCTGMICIDEGQCKQVNISSLLRTLYFGFNTSKLQQYEVPVDCNIHIKSKQPFHFESPLMQGDFLINMLCKNRFNDPSLTGHITIASGKLHFPYRSLYITHGKIFFIPQQLDDPIIELVARGKIKKYQITLRLAGSAQHPHITFESVPHLQDEQIITLLLSGSEEGSFLFAMPSVVLHNIQNRIFAQEKSPARSRFESYIKNFLEPFKHIRIVPRFVDQTGRGGFRGAIEINVSERLRAFIQKNFSLTEDTKLEVEYALSDDFTFRAMRDERGDLGGEVEMRWKF